MADEGEHLTEVHTGSEGSAGKWILLLLAVIYVAGSLYFLFNLRERIDQMGKDQTASSAQVAELSKRMQSAEADSEALATQLGMTKKELAARSADFTIARGPGGSSPARAAGAAQYAHAAAVLIDEGSARHNRTPSETRGP